MGLGSEEKKKGYYGISIYVVARTTLQLTSILNIYSLKVTASI